MRQLFHQLFHHSLLVHLHLLYMLRCSEGGQQYAYSRVTCINSSRKILSRIVMFRSFNRIAFSYRMIDYFGLMATVTLLLAHIKWGRRRLGSHQQHGASMSMGDASRLAADVMIAPCSDLRRRLLAMEEEAYNHSTHQDHPRGTPCPSLSSTDATIQLTIPFFGIINVTTKATIPQDNTDECSTAENREPKVCAVDTLNADGLGAQTAVESPSNDVLDIVLNDPAVMQRP
ncbi:hypothetical protein GGR51DRAFT_31342 [Nemania sp. FL0031]|nr:hypothetical protein GGR51DRAFT_31342 [Nemania sp. FL0031]